MNTVSPRFGHPNPELSDRAACPSPGGVVGEGPHSLTATPSAVPVHAMEDVMAERMRAIIRFGHTLEQDAVAPPQRLPELMRRKVVLAIEDLTMRPAADSAEESDRLHRTRIARARREIVQACAMGLAAIDRVDAELAALGAAASGNQP